VKKPFDLNGFDMSHADMPVDAGRLAMSKVATVVRTAMASLTKVVSLAKDKYEVQDTKQGKYNPMPPSRRYAALAVTSALVELAEKDEDIQTFLNDVRASKAAERLMFWQMVTEVEKKHA
jgi:hypothetical protein